MTLKPTLSICMITYNQESYVKQAIESVFRQKTNFPIELVIGDDASSDRTAEIISLLTPPAHVIMKKYLRQTNLGMLKNFTQTLQQCTGQYIALLEGDDYWIDPGKLQYQVEFLNGNVDFAICFHPIKIDTGSGKLEADKSQTERDVSDIYDLASGNFMHTCSVVFRSGLFNEFPDNFYKSTVGDYFLHMLNAQHGKIKRLPKVMGVYRVHAGGVWSMQPNMDFKILTYLEAMIDCFKTDVSAILKKRHQVIGVKSLLKRMGEPGFEERLQRSIKFGSEELQNLILSRNANNSKIRAKLADCFSIFRKLFS